MSAGDILYRPMGSSKQGQTSLVYNIELVDKVVHVLEVLRDAPEGLTLEDLTIRTGYVKSSIHRALASLRWHGYVEQAVASGKYRLGIKCLLLARGLQGSVELLPHARAYLREIVDAFDESAYLAILRGGRGIFVEVVETRRRDLRLVGRGRLLSCHGCWQNPRGVFAACGTRNAATAHRAAGTDTTDAYATR